MSSGPFHYAEAERLLENARLIVNAVDGARDNQLEALYDAAQESTRRAGVHATLALAAATAGRLMCEYIEGEYDAVAWSKATQ